MENSENLLFTSFDNLILVDPNRVVNSFGSAEDRNIKQENLVMYANLECNVQPRSRLIVGEGSQSLETVSIAEVNFLKPNGQNYLTTNWTELQSQFSNPQSANSELLGITSINYKCGASFTPTVNITLEDVRGRALFESPNESIYSVFFNLPYPVFYLTLKGWFGKAVRYSLILQKFQASLDSRSGNFIITLNFIGYKFNVLTDIQMGFLDAVPDMFPVEVTDTPNTESNSQVQASVDQINSNNSPVSSGIQKLGYKKIEEVYRIYKEKKLIKDDFPPLSVPQLIAKLENFEKNVLSGLGEESVEELTDAKQFNSYLTEFQKEVTTAKPDSWKNEFMDEKNYFIVNDKGVKYRVYTYKKTVIDFDAALKKLKSIIDKNNTILKGASTFGEEKGSGKYRISSNISIINISPEPEILPIESEIDVIETAKSRFNKEQPSETDINQIKSELLSLEGKKIQTEDIRSKGNIQPVSVPLLFRFDGEGFFTNQIEKLRKQLDSLTTDIQNDLTARINNLIKSDKGIGFEPSIRNITAVIMASTDAFLRMLDDVHKQAFDNRNSLKKKNCVLSDVKDLPDSPVFPWPQYVREITVDGETKYDQKYPGDPQYVADTGADDYTVWPEVEFVEEYQRAYLERLQTPLNVQPQDNEETTIKRLLISGFDVSSNTPYSNLQVIPFLFEIWERIETIARYQGFGRQKEYDTILNFLQAFEATNIKVGIGTVSDELLKFLKEFSLTPNQYLGFLQLNAQQSYELYKRGIYVTKYLGQEVETPSKIITEELPKVAISIETENNAAEVEDTIKKYLKDTNKNSIEFTDTYPFIDKTWNLTNLNDGQSNSDVNIVLDISKSLYYDPNSKKILNYENGITLDLKGDGSKNKPFNYFVDLSQKIKTDTIDTPTKMSVFLNERPQNVKNAFFTEGNIQTQTTGHSTTSMLNTPMFINAMQNGVENYRGGSTYPYLQAAYLFLNSLPVSNMKWKYLNSDDTKNNYIGPSFKKYGANHSIPKTLACKIGSIWYRYKEWINNGVDFLSTCMGDFDQYDNYDPLTMDSTRQYNFNVGPTQYHIKLFESIALPDLTIRDVMNVGFYPKTLNDFYFFFNGENLYLDDATIQDEIQEKINNGDVIIVSNSLSQFNKDQGYDPSQPNRELSYATISVLFKKKEKDPAQPNLNYFYTAPSFGSTYTQVLSQCFKDNALVEDIISNQSVFNGSVRLFWGGTHFGYFPTVSSVSQIDEYLSKSNSEKWAWNLFLDDNFDSVTGDKIEDLFSVFTKEELDLFENEFFNFSRSELQTTDPFNFQTILKKSLQLNQFDFLDANQNKLLNNVQTSQQNSFNGYLKNVCNENLIFQKGNPTNFDLKNFRFFTENPVEGSYEDVLKYSTDTFDYLPNGTNGVTFEDSRNNYTDLWRTMDIYVGFSTIPQLSYTGDSSYITDFFIDNDVAFNNDNIIRFADEIKLYASRKLLVQGAPFNFFTQMEDYLESLNVFRDYILEGVIKKLQRSLPTPQNTQTEDKSATEGSVTRLEYYNLFKTINDKWVAGNNYNNETLFEDILFLDRANRNIGDIVIVDIFDAVKYLKGNKKANVYTVVTSIIEKNHFVIYNMPSYINYYNAQNAGETLKTEPDLTFASKLFGTFTQVDYQESKTKMVCQYAETPSEHTKNSSTKNAYNDDSWEFDKANSNPTLENMDKKKEQDDYSLSNRAVAFAVDFGLQNQGVFQNIQVAQDMGKATSESLQAEYDLANMTRGTKTTTQNVSLYNIYKSRSYSATVNAFGNAMIQPTMYFVLKNVPLFAGPYLITDVEHTITNGSFTTKMVGTRQKLYTPPIKNSLLETIKNNYVDKLVNQLVNKKQTEKTISANTINTKNSISSDIQSKMTPSPNQTCKTSSSYGTYSATTVQETSTPFKQMIDTVRDKIREFNFGSNSGDSMNYIVSTLFYVKSFDTNGFKYYNNNVSGIPIGEGTPAWGGNLPTLFDKSYICLNNSENKSYAYAVFTSLDNNIRFTWAKYKTVFDSVVQNIENEDLFVSGFTRTWIEKFPTDKTDTTNNLYESFKTDNPQQFQTLENKVRDGYRKIKSNFT